MSRSPQSLLFLFKVAALCQQPLLTLSPQRQPWHALEAQECQSLLASGEDGLSTAQVAARLAEHGPNRIELAAGRSPWRILWDQISNVMLLMLLAVAAVSAVVAHLGQT